MFCLENLLFLISEFMRFVMIVEEDRIRYKDTLKELNDLKEILKNTQTELTTLERKNDLVRQMFDKEKALRMKAEKELETKVSRIKRYFFMTESCLDFLTLRYFDKVRRKSRHSHVF